MRVIVAVSQAILAPKRPAALLACVLHRELESSGHEASILRLPKVGHGKADLLSAYRMLSVPAVDRFLALDLPSCLIRHHHRVLWLETVEEGLGSRELWKEVAQESRWRFALSATAAFNVRRHLGVDVEPLYPPEQSHPRSRRGGIEGDLLLPVSRDSPDCWALVLEAMAEAREPVRVRLWSVSGERLVGARRVAKKLGISQRCSWVETEENADWTELLHACRAMLAVRKDEANPQLPIRAMTAGRAVITTVDSGSAAELVVDEVSGRHVRSSPPELARAMDEIWRQPERAAEWGSRASEQMEREVLDWPGVLQRLLC